MARNNRIGNIESKPEAGLVPDIDRDLGFHRARHRPGYKAMS